MGLLIQTDIDAFQGFSDAFERGSSVLTNNDQLSRAVFAAKALNFKRNGQQCAAICASKNGRLAL